ncbi:ubiquitin-like protein Pup [Brachybacterium huguangmaarense]
MTSQPQQSAHGTGPGGDDSPEAGAPAGGQVFASVQGSDDLLDEIDSVLESNAETFVRSFVQKGGQ